MTGKHRDPLYQRNARTIRTRVQAIHRRGNAVPCWRCRGPIHPGQPFDVGHRDPNGGNGMGNLAPEHRHRTGGCPGNRAEGGRVGAAITNMPAPKRDATTWKL